jgi:hypothetical protein
VPLERSAWHRLISKSLADLSEALGNTLAQLGQLLGPEENQNDDENYNEIFSLSKHFISLLNIAAFIVTQK